MADLCASDFSKQRFAEPVKFLPVMFVCSIIGGLYMIYMRFHIPLRMQSAGTDVGAVMECVAFNAVTLLLVTCYLKCTLLHPGSIPDKDEDPTWEYVPRDAMAGESSFGVSLQESKRSGDRRHCKWCGKFKPDRTHHCRVCRSCILKMDHHCPWIYNCVGFKNHKYFFLLLFYAVIDLQIIFWTMLPSVTNSVDSSTPFIQMFLLLFGETLAGFLGVMISLFFCFHIFLMLNAMTTIEFCEKQWKRAGHSPSTYDRGFYGNIKAVLGDNVHTWLLPMDPPAGKGLSFISEDTKLTDVEAGRAGRTYQHQLGDSGAPLTRRPGKGSGVSGGTGSAPSDAEFDESGQESDLSARGKGSGR
jgi:hypothetical protein